MLNYYNGDILRTLMLQDKEVLQFNKSQYIITKVINPHLAPLGIRRQVLSGNLNQTYGAVIEWLNSRHAPLNRDNMKVLMQTMGLNSVNKVLNMLICKGLSVTDSYWLREDNIKTIDTWKKINLYENKFSKAIGDVALTGKSTSSRVTLQGNLRTPEITTDGSYAKCWRRYKNKIYLYKSSYNEREAITEAVCSDIADILKLEHIHYDLVTYQNRECCRCENMTNLKYSKVSAVELLEYLGIPAYTTDLIHRVITALDNKNKIRMYNMMVFDGLIGNNDRHLNNWGGFMDNQTGKFIGIHPVFDNNNAISLVQRKENRVYNKMGLLQPGQSTMKLAQLSLRHCTLDIKALGKWYQTKRCENYFIKMYGELDGKERLGYLKQLYKDVLKIK